LRQTFARAKAMIFKASALDAKVLIFARGRVHLLTKQSVNIQQHVPLLEVTPSSIGQCLLSAVIFQHFQKWIPIVSLVAGRHNFLAASRNRLP
jgi:hypothetical protein